MAKTPKKIRTSISQAEYARHRDCSRSAVHQAIADGRLRDSIIIERVGGRDVRRIIAADLADAEWERNTNIPRIEPAPLSPKEAREARMIEARDCDLEVAPITQVRKLVEIEKLEKMRLQREAAERQALLDKGEMILASDARAKIAQLFGVVRRQLRQVPTRIAQQHAGIDRSILHTIADEIDTALTELADME